MKKLFYVLISLLFIYLLLSKVILSNDSMSNTYNIYRKGYDVKINEQITESKSEDKNLYEYEIEANEVIFELTFLDNLNSEKNIVDLELYEDEDYSCLYVKFKNNKKNIDINCKGEEEIYYNLTSIDKHSEELQKFYNSIDSYNINNFNNNAETDKYSLVDVYKNNLNKEIIFSITDYKGLYIMDSEVENIKLFDEDIYNKQLSTYIDKYYFVADYADKHDYKKFYLVDLSNSKIHDILSEENLSKDSYIAGQVDNNIYIVDRGNKQQFKVDVESKTMEIVGNEDKGMYYYDGNKLEIVPSTRFTIEKNYFKEKELKLDGYNYLATVNFNDKNVYSYYYQKQNDNYNVYRIDENNKKKFIFTTKNEEFLSNVIVSNEYIMWQENDKINYYSDSTGIKSIIKSNELTFNEDIKYYIYNK